MIEEFLIFFSSILESLNHKTDTVLYKLETFEGWTKSITQPIPMSSIEGRFFKEKFKNCF
jgi:hypothetical protein